MNGSRSKTVLVVDDDVSIVHALKKRLAHEGYRVLSALDGNEALSFARNDRVDAITLDVALGGSLNGLDVAAALHRDPRTAAIPIVFVTGTADDQFHEKCQAVGGAFFLSKPYDARLVIRLLEGIFAKDELAEVQRLSQAKRRQPIGASMNGPGSDKYPAAGLTYHSG